MTFDSVYSLNVMLKTQEMELNQRKTKVAQYRFRFSLSIFACIALDVAIVTVVEVIYSLSKEPTPSQPMLPKMVEYLLQIMMGCFILAYFVFGAYVRYWFRQEVKSVQELVRSCSFKFIGVFVL